MKTYTLFLFTTIALFLHSTSAAQYKHDSLRTEHGYIHYYTKGKGEPLVLLQGGPGFSSFYMRSIADSLPNNRCILIDYEGTGRSQYRKADSSWVSPEKVIADIEKIREKLAISCWTLLGHSYGTHFALLYASTYPNRVKNICLAAFIGTNNGFQRYSGDNISVRLTEKDLEQLDKIAMYSSLSKDESEFQTQSILMKGYFFDRSKIAPFLKSTPKEESAFFFSDSYNYAYWKNPNYWTWDISAKALALNLPITIIQGRQDFVNDGNQDLFNYKAKRSKMYYIEKCGHFAWVEQPKQFFEMLRKALITD